MTILSRRAQLEGAKTASRSRPLGEAKISHRTELLHSQVNLKASLGVSTEVAAGQAVVSQQLSVISKCW